MNSQDTVVNVIINNILTCSKVATDVQIRFLVQTSVLHLKSTAAACTASPGEGSLPFRTIESTPLPLPASCLSGTSAALFEECFHFQIFHGQYRHCQEPSAFKHFFLCPDSNLPCTVHVLKETPLRVTHNYQCSVWGTECIDIILMAQRSLFYFQLYVNTFAEQCICILLCANNRK